MRRKKAAAAANSLPGMQSRLAGVRRPGETLIAGSTMVFPSGRHMRVRGFRSFRDFQGRDISGSIPGWPRSRRRGEPPARYSVKGILLSAWWITGFVFDVLSALVPDSRSVFEGLVDPEYRKDFQVLSADPGTIALGAPWQLDPGRKKARPHTWLHVTDRRLLFTDPVSDALLWEVAREDVESITYRGGRYVRFVDRSWIYIRPDWDNTSYASDRDEEYTALSDTIDMEHLHEYDCPANRFFAALDAFAPAAARTSESG